MSENVRKMPLPNTNDDSSAGPLTRGDQRAGGHGTGRAEGFTLPWAATRSFPWALRPECKSLNAARSE